MVAVVILIKKTCNYRVMSLSTIHSEIHQPKAITLSAINKFTTTTKSSIIIAANGIKEQPKK
jgi:hypothetical protein